MSRLKVLLRGALISEITLNPEKEYIAGRKDGSDIRLQAEKGISREHFRLKIVDSHWTIQAISRFGELYSLGKKVEELTLEHGQSFQVPPYEFQLVDVPASDVSTGYTSGQGPISDTTNTVFGAAPQVPYIKIVNSKAEVTEMLRLEVGDLWVAGRDPSCQIVIPDQRVSRRQFEIHKVNGIFTILDLASVNGTFLNGSSISTTDPQALRSGDAITVLDNTLYFELHDPNFKFKVEKIDIPLFANESEPESNSDFDQVAEPTRIPSYASEIPMIADDVLSEQMKMNQGGPFTGIPPKSDTNQFFSFTPPQEPITKTPWQKFISNKPLVAIAALIFLAAAYFISDSLETPAAPVVEQKIQSEGEAFSKLTPKQQSEVKELYSLAEQMKDQQKYDLELEKIRKIHEIIKDGYKESKSWATQAEQSLAQLQQGMEDEKRAKEEEERKKLFAEVAIRCAKLLTPKVDVDKVRECLMPISAIDPSNADYIRIIADAEKIVNESRIKEAEKKTLQEQIDELKKLFASAEKVQSSGFAFKAIKQYQLVQNAKLPDPGHLKAKAKTRITFIQQKIEEKTLKSVNEAESLFQQGKLKQSIYALRESLVYDPENQKVKDKIDKYTTELRRQMMNIYQESVIDESYGIVENTETRQGSKEKWKKIVELDIDDGEYYKKAVIKLRKYGVF